ncbi:PfkB family carbohydrate kinase [Occallatibacter riparius]|uniref:PfkB family carbohydrate kinase n=1 Tax=Occallatibacter riparius TaxID=1002689 RepID=A0A9J7BR39_9BACT|nr:PfkB family carbohydrate kinase [Occallatibacter riparius]UWZ85144.1 PfkB family carbohydrate kinase [Occallatibacter riparius]
MSNPSINPIRERIHQNDAISVKDDVVLRFGMLEGTAVVDSEFCVYDPQSAFAPERFGDNGSRASRLAIVANRNEIRLMTGLPDPIAAAQSLLLEGAELVVIKGGTEGALVVQASGVSPVPAFESRSSWTIGSGDVFAAIFAARWAGHQDTPEIAAELASRGVAEYAEAMALPIPNADVLRATKRRSVTRKPGRVYLAGPFFSLGQRWIIDELRSSFLGFGLGVFSPVHDVGRGPAEVVGPADLNGLECCDRLFAVLDGLDPGTIFEIGYARRMGLPVYVLAQSVAAEDLKMIQGSGCRIFDDLSTAVHHTVWLV